MAACGLTLVAASFAQAQSPTTATSSTDIYTTDFQSTFATGQRDSEKDRLQWRLAGSTDIWTTDFQRTFATDKSVHETADAGGDRGSTNIWATDFQKSLHVEEAVLLHRPGAPHSRRRSASIEDGAITRRLDVHQ